MALLAAVLFTAPLVAAPPFRFTALPDEDETRLRQRFGKVAAYLEQSLGVQVEYIPVKSYAAAVTAFANNQVQMAWFGGLSGVRARKIVAGSQAIAQGHEDQFFVTYFIAHASTGLRESEWFPTAIKGLTFTFDATTGSLILLVLGNMLITVLTLGFGLPFVQVRKFRYFCDRLTAAGTADFEDIRRSTESQPTIGEGLADAFDIDAI
ncbi:MAG: DUF898 family protein [SAR324 cluster bacterium]|nr:DUF898 family protein [SAR324 cluster bacterium]